jgi:hypothetical protein
MNIFYNQMIRQGYLIKMILVGSLLIVVNCATIDVSTLKTTDLDKESLQGFDEKNLTAQGKVGILLKQSVNPKITFPGKEKLLDSESRKLVESIGGAEIVYAQKDWDVLFKKSEEQVKKYFAELKLAAQMGKEIKLKKIETKYDSWYQITLDVIDLGWDVREGTKRDRDGNQIQYWKLNTLTTLGLTITQTDPGQDSKVLLIKNITNKFNKTFPTPPEQGAVLKGVEEGVYYSFEDALPVLQEVFPINSKILELREEKSYARILGGKKLGLVPGREFDILDKGEITTVAGTSEIFHPIGKIKLFQVDDAYSWGEISGEKEIIKKGMDLKSKPQEMGIFGIAWRFIKSRLGITSDRKEA